MAIEAPVRATLLVLAVFLPIGVATSIWRGDTLSAAVGHAVVGIGVCGLLVGGYAWVRRKS
jgi:hypothetical protein